jgi:hypothetical protein
MFGKSLPRQRPHLYVYGTNANQGTVARARAFATLMADRGPGVGARFSVKRDADVTAEEKARFDLVLVGASPLNSLSPADKPVAADAAFRLLTRSATNPGRHLLVFGATTFAGFEKLKRFATHNADYRAPEANRDWIDLGTAPSP